MKVKEVFLKNYSSLQIGGRGYLVAVKNEEELVKAIMHAKSEGLRMHILGEGTNTYFGDSLSKYLFIKNEIKGIKWQTTANSQQPTENSNTGTGNEILLTVMAGENWDDVVKYAVKKNLWGIENLSYIPGSVGAAPVQNIGAYGMELKESLVSVKVFDTKEEKFKVLSNKDCKFAYRDSIFKHQVGRFVITEVKLRLSKKRNPILTYKPLNTLNKNASIKEIRNAVVKIRKEKLPDYNKYPNCGSFFKNPKIRKKKGEELRKKFKNIQIYDFENMYKISAAWLIENIAEMKEVREGDIGTWKNQALVLVNYGKTTPKEIENFTKKIVNKIKKVSEISLEREVNFIK